MFDAEQASFVCDFIECLTTSSGMPFRLMDWQRAAIMDFYGPQIEDESTHERLRRLRYLYLEIPKKNGKTELAAALGVYHTFADGETNGETYIVAADRENASIAFDAAVYMIEHCPALAKRCRIIKSIRTVIDNVSGSKMKVLSSEAYSKHGYKPSCVIFDELHAQPNRELWDVMTFGAGDARRQPVWLVLTTAGDDADRKSIGWEIHCKARDILRYRAGERDEGLQDDDEWLPIMYGLGGLTDDPDKIAKIDIQNEAVWRACNPSIGVTVPLRTIRKEALDAKRSESAERLFRWLRLNQWIATHTVGWLPVTIYDKTQWNPEGCKDWREAIRLLAGKTCYGGVDLSSTTDLTAFVLLFPPQDGLDKWVALPYGWVPGQDIEARERRDHVPYRDWIRAGFLRECTGDMMDYDDIFEVIVEAAQTYDLKMIGFDPYLSRTLTQRVISAVEQSGTQVVEIPQGIRHMTAPMKEAERMIRSHEMLHVHNTAARWCFGNVRCETDKNENISPTKKRSTGRIDMTVAWIIAVAASMLQPAPSLAEAVASDHWTM